MRKNRIGIAVITALFLVLIIGGQVTSAQIEQKATFGEVTTYTIGYLPITHALPFFEEKELLELENQGIRIELQKFSSWSDLTDALHAGKTDGASELIELAMSAKAKGVDLKAVTQGFGNVLERSEDLWNDSVCCGLIFRTDVIEKDPEKFKKLVDGYKDAGERLDRSEAIRIAEKSQRFIYYI